MEQNIINQVFTENNNEIDATLNNINLNCLTNRNNNFSLDSDGNLIVKSITTTATNSSSNLTFNDIYPVGSIYMSVNNTNPSTLFGGSWQQFAKGRTLVGVNTSETEFNSVEKTGGSKYPQKHYHDLRFEAPDGNGVSISHTANGGSVLNISNFDWSVNKYNEFNGTSNLFTNEAGDGTSGNLQPYITCYIWKRTS